MAAEDEADEAFKTYQSALSELNNAQRSFVCHYLIHFNGTRAAIEAGYSEKTSASQASTLLKNPKVSRAVQLGRAATEKALGLDAHWVLANLMEVTNRCMEATPVFGMDGKPIPGKWTFNAKGATSALELIGKRLKLFTEKTEVSGPNGGPIQTDAKVVFVELPSNGRDTNRPATGPANGSTGQPG